MVANLLNSDQLKWVPLFTPAVQNGSYEVDHKLLEKRILAITAIALTIIGLSLTVVPFSWTAFVIFVCIGAIPVVAHLDSQSAEEAVRYNVVTDYLNNPEPSTKASIRIQRDIKTAQLYIQKKGDVLKLDELGHSLLDYTLSSITPDIFETYKLLLEHCSNIFAKDQPGRTVFQQTVENLNPALLKHLLDTREVNPATLPTDQQIQLWLYLQKREVALMLHGAGFDVNVSDENGYTPLMYLVRPGIHFMSISREDHVRALIECGADVTLTVNEGGERKNIFQLNMHPGLTPILEEAHKKQTSTAPQ